jgi:hypothetical protein
MPQTSRCWVAEGISIDRVIGDRLRDLSTPEQNCIGRPE